MKKILVVGGAGYVGGITTDLLLKRGFDITVFDNLLYESRFLKKCNFIHGDIRDTQKIVEISTGFDEILWLAAIVGDGACAQSPELTKEINENCLGRFLNRTKRRIIFTSTCSVYGAQDTILDESSDVSPLSLYASTKLRSEEKVLQYGGLVFRLGTLFGLGDSYSRIRLDLVVNVLTLKAHKNEKITVFGGEQWRPVIAVSDAANYLAESVDSDLSGIYNIKLENTTILELAKRIASIFPEVKIEETELAFEDLRNYRIDSGKAEKYFEFNPMMSVEDSVEQMKRLFEENRICNTEDDIYYNTRHVEMLIGMEG